MEQKNKVILRSLYIPVMSTLILDQLKVSFDA